MSPRVAYLGVLLVMPLWVSSASAQGSWEGTWSAGRTQIRVRIESWGPDCGPRPQDASTPAAGTIRITQAGEQLVFHGNPERRTDRCWSDNRAVRRVSASHQQGVWRVSCRTAPADPRSERGTYTLRAVSEDLLRLTDASHYDWQPRQSSRCVGTVTSTQSFTRVLAPEATSEPAPTRERCTPGDPARVQLRPSEAQIEPGDEVRIRARVLDQAGCPVAGQTVRWELLTESQDAVLDQGLLRTGQGTQGELQVVAHAGSLRGRSTVTVRAADLSDLIARRASGGVVRTEDLGDARGETATGISARRDTKGSKALWPFVLGVVSLAGLILLTVLRRLASTPGSDPDHSRSQASSPGPAPRSCPVCHEQYEDVLLGFCPNDGARLADVEAGPVDAEPLICPTCRRGYPPGARFCLTDSAELMPYTAFVERHKATEETHERPMICPKCDTRYETDVTFCGKDGAELKRAR